MRRAIPVLLIIVFSMFTFNFTLNFPTAKATASKPKVDWALIIQGTDYGVGRYGLEEIPASLHDCYYMFYILTHDLGVPRDHIKFLSLHKLDYEWLGDVPPGTFDDFTDPEAVMNAFAWLKSKSTINDNVLIFIFTHGGGYKPDEGLRGGRIDLDGDEGNEHWDGTKWFGVDECLRFGSYGGGSEWFFWDDEFRGNLTGLSYKTLTIIITACFAGGFIDDLSGPNRIIITSSKETTYTHVDKYADFGLFNQHLLDALHGYHAIWNETAENRITDQYEVTVPDLDCNGIISWREIYHYAKDKYPDDEPWCDANGNGLPTYKDGKNYREYFLWVWHNWGGYTTPNTGEYRLRRNKHP